MFRVHVSYIFSMLPVLAVTWCTGRVIFAAPLCHSDTNPRVQALHKPGGRHTSTRVYSEDSATTSINTFFLYLPHKTSLWHKQTYTNNNKKIVGSIGTKVQGYTTTDHHSNKCLFLGSSTNFKNRMFLSFCKEINVKGMSIHKSESSASFRLKKMLKLLTLYLPYKFKSEFYPRQTASYQ